MRVTLAIILIILISCSGEKDADGLTPIIAGTKTEWNLKRQVARVDHSFYGCFGGNESELVISELRDGGYVATFRVKGRKPLTKVLTYEGMAAFSQFVKALNKYSTGLGGCTTEETFRVALPDRVIEKTNSSCNFRYYDQALEHMSFSYSEDLFDSYQ